MSWPANMFAGNRTRQDAGRAAFNDIIRRNLEPPENAPIYGSAGEREYGSTYPFHRFPPPTRVNSPAELQASSRFVRHSPKSRRPVDRRGGRLV